jgi:hypothetical protein
VNVLALVLFVAFVAAAVRAGARTGPEDRRRRIHHFLLLACAGSFGAGLAQRDAWPFCAWPLVAGRVPVLVTQPRVFVVDSAGEEYPADYRAWRPFSYVELLSWLDKDFMRLTPDARRRAALHLVVTAGSRTARGDRIRCTGTRLAGRADGTVLSLAPSALVAAGQSTADAHCGAAPLP